MTTGTYTLSNAVTTPSASGNGLVGVSTTKTWSGTDYPKAVPQRTSYSYPVTRKKYKVLAGKRVLTYVQAYKLRSYSTKPPVRARTEEHPYSMSYRRVDYQIWDQRNNPQQSYTPNRWGWDQYMLPPLDPWGPNDDIKLYGKLREAVAGSGFNAGVAIAESKPALDMITNAAMRIYWGYRAAKQGDFRSAHRYLVNGTDRARKSLLGNKERAKNWLELQYGWLPLLNDVSDGAKFLAHHHSYPLQKVIRVSNRKVSTVRLVNSDTRPIFGEAYTVKSIKAILKEKDVIALSGLTDPLSVAWEALPYSFVLDWFIPVGNYLSARGLAQSLTGTFVTSTKTVRQVKGLKGGVQGTYGISSALSPCEKAGELTIDFSRTISSSLSIPLPEVKPLASVPSWVRAANAVSLLAVLRK